MKENLNTTNSRQERIGENRNIDTLKRIIASLIGMVFFTLLASCSQGGGSAGQNQDGISATGQGFSADMIVTLPSGQVLMESKIFVTPGATRVDWEQGGSNLTSIRLEKENREYLYNHDKKVYHEMDLNEDEEISNFLKSINDYEVIEVLGNERVNGMNCTKKKARSSFEVMGMNITNELIIWQADGIDFPIRAEGEEGTVTELKNINKKTPSPKLFQPMQGYKRVSNMMEVMGFGGMGFGMDGLDDYGNDEKDIDVDEVYDQVNKIMQSLLMNAEDKQQAEEILAHARELAKEMDITQGATVLWSIVPPRPGDKILSENSSKFMSEATLGSNAPIGTILNHYQKQLATKGWNVDGKSIFQGQGVLMMSYDGSAISVASVDENKPAEKFPTIYSINYHPDNR